MRLCFRSRRGDWVFPGLHVRFGRLNFYLPTKRGWGHHEVATGRRVGPGIVHRMPQEV